MSYLQESFLLSTAASQRLYDVYAKDQPIFDYHCHLPEQQLLEDAPFTDVYQIWLAGDHYKWRLMRNYGVSEELITGDRSPKEKFLAYCRVLGTAFGNPLYHWSQVELETFFHCDLEINEENGEAIWEHCLRFLAEHVVTPSSLIRQSGVRCLFTTNEVFDDLSPFVKIREMDRGYRVLPAFRADKIMNVEAPNYRSFLARLEALTGPISCLADLEGALESRLQAFLAVGAKASDIALEQVYPVPSAEEADRVFRTVLGGTRPKEEEVRIFKGYVTYFLLGLYGRYQVVTELHLGAMRNNNRMMLDRLGLDSGYDSISQANSTTHLSRLLDRLHSEGRLPRMILFNLNPKMNAELMTLLGCFQDGSAKGKIQYGPAWWFLDHQAGMEQHLRDLTATGHLATFVGMLTDSRSLLSYPRHHYFRRILCDYLGRMMEAHLITQDFERVGGVVRDICYRNAVEYFGMEIEL